MPVKIVKTKKKIKPRMVPIPTKDELVLYIGTRVYTPKGKGTVVDVLLSIGTWPGSKGMMPPKAVIQLDEPWEEKPNVTVGIQDIHVGKKGRIFRRVVQDQWPGLAPRKPTTTLRPTTEPGSLEEMKTLAKVRVSDLIRKQS